MIALSTPPVLLIVVGVVVLIAVIATLVGRGLMRMGADYPEHPTFAADSAPLGDFIAERREAEARAMAAARRARERREQNLTLNKRAAAARKRPAA